MRKNRVGLLKNGYSMMTVDDDPNINDALKSYFEASGYQVDTDTDPVRALERMKQKQYDILLLDFIMRPFCGDVFVSRLRQFDRKVFVILLTGHRELAPPLNTIRELDIQGYYEKSERFDQLELLVESCIKSIKQMKLIGQYQDGLSTILDSMPEIHQFMPMEDVTSKVAGHLNSFCDSPDSFVWLKKTPELVAQDGTDSAGDNYFKGNGVYGEGLAAFRDRMPMELRIDIESALEFCRPVLSDTHIVAPLLSQNGKTVSFGVIGVARSESQSEAVVPLVSVYAEQASTALHNTMLNIQLNKRNSELSDAYTMLRDSYLQTVEAIRLLVDAKDIYTRGHSDRVSFFALELAKLISGDELFLERVKVAGLLHDVGKMGVSDIILTKPEKLTGEEFEVIKQHPQIGATVLEKITMFSELAPIVRAHHERNDGLGYPDGLKGEDIPLEARIITIADAFDAMMSDRHYRVQLSIKKAIGELEAGRGNQFDPQLVDYFLKIVRNYEAIHEQLKWTYR